MGPHVDDREQIDSFVRANDSYVGCRWLIASRQSGKCNFTSDRGQEALPCYADLRASASKAFLENRLR